MPHATPGGRLFEPLKLLWQTMLASLWFLPTLIVASSLLLAVALVEVSVQWGNGYADHWPMLLSASAEGARGMLSAIATSMATVAGVVFSITIVALSLASSQYSPRVLTSFMSDRATQGALGVFVGTFTYCLVVMRTIRSPDEGGGFVPALAVVAGVALALCGVGVLIYFIHHVASSITVSSLLERIGDDTVRSIDRLFPDPVGREAPVTAVAPALPSAWQVVTAHRSGYLMAIHDQALLSFALESGRVVRFTHCMGDFVVEDQPLAYLSGEAEPSSKEIRRLRSAVIIGQRRTVEQDAPYGFQQLVDIALRALSPGVNDPTTACMCLDQLTRLWVRLAGRRMPSPNRSAEGRLRLVLPGPSFERVFRDSFEPIVQSAGGSTAVWESLLRAVDALDGVVKERERRMLLQEAASMLRAGIDASVCLADPHRRLSELATQLYQNVRRAGGPALAA